MSKVTKKDIAKSFNVSLDNVEQIQSKQLFIVYTSNAKLLVSYYTVIGIFYNGVVYITLEKFSVTTSKQTRQFINSTSHKIERVGKDTFNSMYELASRGLPPVIEVE